MQYTEKTDLRAEMFWVASDFEKGFRAGAKQEVVEDLFILQHQRSQATGQGEDYIEIARREKVSWTRRPPQI